VRQSARNEPIGCAHLYCRRDDVEAITETVNDRFLCDEEGVWFAATAADKALLHAYCQRLFTEKKKICNFPRGLVRIEAATSTVSPPPQRDMRFPAGVDAFFPPL